MSWRNLTGPFGLLLTGTLLGVPLGMSIVPFLLWNADGQWIGFAGAVAGGVAGGAMTLIAGFLAWSAAMVEIERSQRKEEREADDILALLNAYAGGVIRACRNLEPILDEISLPGSFPSRLPPERYAMIAIAIDNTLNASRSGVRAEDIDGLSHKLPLGLLSPVRDLTDRREIFLSIRDDLATALRRQRDFDTGELCLPVKEALTINGQLKSLRRLATRVQERVEQERYE